MIPFNKPCLTGKEAHYIYQAVYSGKISGNGYFTKKCQQFFIDKFNFPFCLLTSSCTDALEMAALLIDVQPGDEIILPSYTFVSTANAFILRGANLVFADSCSDHPCIDAEKIESLITEKTKAIVPVHYAGIACNMDKIMEISNKHDLYIIEDAAQAIDSYYIDKKYNKKPLGSIGHLSTFSFHETKNIISGEGGMLVVNETDLQQRAEIIWEKGTNRSAFFRGEIDKYGWVDVGSSFLPSEVTAAFLFAQLEHLSDIQDKRKSLWSQYFKNLKNLKTELFKLPHIPAYGTNNAHMFYLTFNDKKVRNYFINELKNLSIHAVFHYQSLHKSFFAKKCKIENSHLPFSDYYSDTLLRLPLYSDLKKEEVEYIVKTISKLCQKFKKI